MFADADEAPPPAAKWSATLHAFNRSSKAWVSYAGKDIVQHDLGKLARRSSRRGLSPLEDARAACAGQSACAGFIELVDSKGSIEFHLKSVSVLIRLLTLYLTMMILYAGAARSSRVS